MATNKKITELTELVKADLADDDVLAIVDVSAGETFKVRKSTLASALAGVASLAATTPVAVSAGTGSVTISGVDYEGTFAGKSSGTRGTPANFNFLDTPNTTSEVRYTVQIMHNSGTYSLNQRDGNYAGSSTMIAIEIGA